MGGHGEKLTSRDLKLGLVARLRRASGAVQSRETTRECERV